MASPSTSSSQSSLAAALLLPLVLVLVQGSPPGPVVTCRSGNTTCTVKNAYGTFPDRSKCAVAAVAYPSSEAELFDVVAGASARKQHMKVVTVYSHSIPKLSCPGGPSGSGMVISTMFLNKVVSVDVAAARMTVEAGITLRQFLDEAAAVGLALPYTPYWQGMTIGGLIATASHGSSMFDKGSAVHEYVVGMRLVVPVKGNRRTRAGARIIQLGEDDPDLLAAKVALGVLGAVSQVTLQLQPTFKRSITYRLIEDSTFESTLASFGATTEFGDATWYPSQHRVVFRDDVRVPVATPGMGFVDFFPPQLSILITSRRLTEEVTEFTEDALGKCMMTEIQLTTQLQSGNGLRNNDGSLLPFTGYPVVGNQSVMQASGSCLNSEEDNLRTVCMWDPRIRGQFYYQTTLSIVMSSVPAFVADVRRLRDAFPNALCDVDLYSGFIMRFIRNSTAYLGKPSDCVEVDITYYRSHDPTLPRLNEDVLEEVEQMALFKYNGLPHWGKNRNVGFIGVRNKLGSRVDDFVAVMEKYDPEGLFSSDWTDAVLGKKGSPVIVRNGCALEGLCICSTDDHCAPERGYYCRPGVVYQEARVCSKRRYVQREQEVVASS